MLKNISIIFLIILFTISCSSWRSIISRNVDITKYKIVVLGQSNEASFFELEIEQLFLDNGFNVVSLKEAGEIEN